MPNINDLVFDGTNLTNTNGVAFTSTTRNEFDPYIWLDELTSFNQQMGSVGTVAIDELLYMPKKKNKTDRYKSKILQSVIKNKEYISNIGKESQNKKQAYNTMLKGLRGVGYDKVEDILICFFDRGVISGYGDFEYRFKYLVNVFVEENHNLKTSNLFINLIKLLELKDVSNKEIKRIVGKGLEKEAKIVLNIIKSYLDKIKSYERDSESIRNPITNNNF